MLGVAFAVCKIKASAIQVGILGFLPVKYGKRLVPASIHDFQPPFGIPHLAVLEIFLLLFRKLPTGAVHAFQRKFALDIRLAILYNSIRRANTFFPRGRVAVGVKEGIRFFFVQ